MLIFPWWYLYIETAPVPQKLIAHTKSNLEVEFYEKGRSSKIGWYFPSKRALLSSMNTYGQVWITANMVFLRETSHASYRGHVKRTWNFSKIC